MFILRTSKILQSYFSYSYYFHAVDPNFDFLSQIYSSF